VGAICALAALVTLATLQTPSKRTTELDWLEGYEWEAPYPGAGPETPAWEVTPASVGQLAEDAFDPSHSESNVLGNDYKFPDYARKPRTSALSQLPAGTRLVSMPQLQQQNLQGARVVQTPKGPMLWVGSPQKFLPPDGDYPGGSTGIPLDGYLAYETGYANDGPFHGELAPIQEAGIADKAVPMALRFRNNGKKLMMPVLSIIDPGQEPEPFDDWDLGNSQADLDKTYDPNLWENPRQPLSKYNMGKVTCIMGEDCHDGTHQGGQHDNGLQLYDNRGWSRGSIDPNSDKSVHAEYKTRVGKQQALHYVSTGAGNAQVDAIFDNMNKYHGANNHHLHKVAKHTPKD